MKKLLLLACLFVSALASQAQTINCSAMCVLNISNLDTISNEVDVTIYNGDTNHVNYPTVVLVDGFGDTIGNINNVFYLFAHMPGDTVDHTIPCTLDSIPSGFTCTVYFTDQVWDTTCMFSYPMSCTVGINELLADNQMTVYPNPATEYVEIGIEGLQNKATVQLFNMLGKELQKFETGNSKFRIERNDLAAGIYLIQVTVGEKRIVRKIILE